MYTIEMLRGKEYLGKFDYSNSWLEESDKIPTAKEVHKMMIEELNFRKSHNLRDVILNVWKGDGDEWRSKLVKSFCKFVEEPETTYATE